MIQRRHRPQTINTSMRSGYSVRLLVAEILMALLVDLTWSTSLNSLEQDRICTIKNGTVCTRMTPEECRFEGLELTTGKLRQSVNPEAFFYATELFNVFDPSAFPRYLHLEWTPGRAQGHLFLRVSPVMHGRVLQDHVICMSNIGHNNTVDEQIPGLDMEKKLLKHSTLVPLPENVTSSLVEVQMNNALSQYLVETPKKSRHSWIFQGVAVTVQDKKAFISVNPSDRLRTQPEEQYRYRYMPTLICYTLLNEHHPSTENMSSLNILSSSLTLANCSKSHAEVYLAYSLKSTLPIVFEMTQSAHELVIDAQLLDVTGKQVVRQIAVRTLIFGYSAIMYEKDHVTTRASADHVWKTISPSGTPVFQNPEMNTSKLDLSMGKSSASLSEKDQHFSNEIKNLVLAVSTAFVTTIIVAVCVIVVIKIRKQKMSQNAAQKMVTSEKYDSVEENIKKSERKLLCATLDSRPTINCGRKPKFRSECCTNRTSDTSCKDDVSDHLISAYPTSNDSFHQLSNSMNLYQSDPEIIHTNINHESTQNDLKIELTLSHLLDSKADVQNYKCEILVNGITPGKQSDNCITPETTKLNRHNSRREIESDTEIQKRYTNYKYRGKQSPEYLSFIQRHLFQNAARSSLNFVQNCSDMDTDVQELQQNFDWEAYSVIEPELYADSLGEQTMESECMKINDAYQHVFANASAGMTQSQSCEVQIDDECFSICESVAC